MRVPATVVGRALQLRGATLHVGERILLDTADPQHREALDRGWAEREAATAAMAAPPVDKMMTPSAAKAQAGGVRKRRGA